MVTRYYEVYLRYDQKGGSKKFIHSFLTYKDALHYIKAQGCPYVFDIVEVLL